MTWYKQRDNEQWNWPILRLAIRKTWRHQLEGSFQTACSLAHPTQSSGTIVLHSEYVLENSRPGAWQRVSAGSRTQRGDAGYRDESIEWFIAVTTTLYVSLTSKTLRWGLFHKSTSQAAWICHIRSFILHSMQCRSLRMQPPSCDAQI